MQQKLDEGEPAPAANAAKGGRISPEDFPVREYVGAMAAELAQMARWDGDDQLACALDIAVELASRPAKAAGPAAKESRAPVKRPS